MKENKNDFHEHLSMLELYDTIPLCCEKGKELTDLEDDLEFTSVKFDFSAFYPFVTINCSFKHTSVLNLSGRLTVRLDKISVESYKRLFQIPDSHTAYFEAKRGKGIAEILPWEYNFPAEMKLLLEIT